MKKFLSIIFFLMFIPSFSNAKEIANQSPNQKKDKVKNLDNSTSKNSANKKINGSSKEFYQEDKYNMPIGDNRPSGFTQTNTQGDESKKVSDKSNAIKSEEKSNNLQNDNQRKDVKNLTPEQRKKIQDDITNYKKEIEKMIGKKI